MCLSLTLLTKHFYLFTGWHVIRTVFLGILRGIPRRWGPVTNSGLRVVNRRGMHDFQSQTLVCGCKKHSFPLIG